MLQFQFFFILNDDYMRKINSMKLICRNIKISPNSHINYIVYNVNEIDQKVYIDYDMYLHVVNKKINTNYMKEEIKKILELNRGKNLYILEIWICMDEINKYYNNIYKFRYVVNL
jgi:hypothetical protein